MAYLICSSERTTASGNDMETRALLHLMCYDEHKDDMDGFAIDFFNDVTGMDHMGYRLYDVQSKKASSGPAAIGEELVTLYKNYVSEFSGYFVEQILFLGSITSTVLTDGTLKEFGYDDMTDRTKKSVRDRLIDTCKKKTYIDDADIEDEKIDAFLNSVRFVVADTDEAHYIKPLIKASSLLLTSDRQLRAIFNEIKNAQSNIKNNVAVEGISVETPGEAYDYGRVLETKKISLLALQRLINCNPYEVGIPTSFAAIYNTWPPERDRELLNECQNGVALQLMDKNAAQPFWELFSQIVTSLENGVQDVEGVFCSIDKEVLGQCRHLNPLSTKFFIAMVKDGLEL